MYFVTAGNVLLLSASVVPENATIRGITWSSGDGSKATVDPVTGLVEGIGYGKTTITATSDADPTIKVTIDLTVRGEAGLLDGKYRTYYFGDEIGTWMIDNLQEDADYVANGFYYYLPAKLETACPQGWRVPSPQDAAKLIPVYPLVGSLDEMSRAAFTAPQSWLGGRRPSAQPGTVYVYIGYMWLTDGQTLSHNANGNSWAEFIADPDTAYPIRCILE